MRGRICFYFYNSLLILVLLFFNASVCVYLIVFSELQVCMADRAKLCFTIIILYIYVLFCNFMQSTGKCLCPHTRTIKILCSVFWEPNLAASLRAFLAEYRLWCSD